MVLDYSKDCAACFTPLTSPPRDGGDSMCAYLHTRQGRREFERTLKRNEATKRVIDAVASPPNEVTSGASEATSWTSEVTKELEVTVNEATLANEVTSDEDEATGEATGSIIDEELETKQQRWRRLNRDKIKNQQRDRRNSHDGDGVL